MKKIIMAAIAAVFMASAASAQTQKGTVYVAARATEFDLNILPNFSVGLAIEGGYFLMDKFAVTAALRFGANDATYNFGLTAGLRYNFTRNFFAGADVGFDKVKGHDATLAFGIFTGYSIFLGRNVALEPILRFGAVGRDVSIGLGLGFGLYF